MIIQIQLSVGALRNHEDIKDMVKAKSLDNRVEQSESAKSHKTALAAQAASAVLWHNS
ncbi:hypothetical protein H4J59_13145 [Colwellia sp. MB02u-10]|uniref:hypothetical protein n=1 Tax=Colwellia sp. MB02u-10 TaxID=2759828 RepID=UPI0015F3EA0F|nr:hypothetical protein [Colwellia sp. MB02u-10]MBA6341935.1 hypothetical protein [Colwellia sp. MB02u-10]